MNAKDKMIEALYKLLAIKDFVDINVSEVCQIAKIHRTTFYAYYSNLLELLEDAKIQAIKEFEEENKQEDKDRNNPRNQIFMNYLYFVKSHAVLFKAYFKNASALGADKDFEELFNKVLLPKAKAKYGDDYKMIFYTPRFFIDGIFAIVKIRMQNGFEETPEELAKIISRINVI